MYDIKYVFKPAIMFFSIALSFVLLPASCFASTWNGIGVHVVSTGQTVCPVTPDTLVDLNSDDYSVSACQVEVGEGNQLTVSQQYKLVMSIIDPDGNYNNAIQSGPAYLPAGVDLSTVNVAWPVSGNIKLGGHKIHLCYMLVNMAGEYFTLNNTPQGCPEGSGGSTPFPSPFQCAFGDGSTLNISLGDVDRTEIGAVPGTFPGTEKNISITCTGEGTATYTIGFQYTAVNIGGSEAISSTANGLAVAMSLNDELVNPTDTYTRTYGTGTQTEKLKFEPIRDPLVKISDIPTGAFSASAVMVLTLQ